MNNPGAVIQCSAFYTKSTHQHPTFYLFRSSGQTGKDRNLSPAALLSTTCCSLETCPCSRKSGTRACTVTRLHLSSALEGQKLKSERVSYLPWSTSCTTCGITDSCQKLYFKKKKMHYQIINCDLLHNFRFHQ